MKALYLIIQWGLTYYCVKSVVSLELGSQPAERFLSTFSECWYGSCWWCEVSLSPSLLPLSTLPTAAEQNAPAQSPSGGGQQVTLRGWPLQRSSSDQPFLPRPWHLNSHLVSSSCLCNSSSLASHPYWGPPTQRPVSSFVIPAFLPSLQPLQNMFPHLHSLWKPYYSTTHCYKDTKTQILSYIKSHVLKHNSAEKNPEVGVLS